MIERVDRQVFLMVAPDVHAERSSPVVHRAHISIDDFFLSFVSSLSLSRLLLIRTVFRRDCRFVTLYDHAR